MNNIFQKIGLSLVVLGIGFYVISDSGSVTALIPSFLGAMQTYLYLVWVVVLLTNLLVLFVLICFMEKRLQNP